MYENALAVTRCVRSPLKVNRVFFDRHVRSSPDRDQKSDLPGGSQSAVFEFYIIGKSTSYLVFLPPGAVSWIG